MALYKVQKLVKHCKKCNEKLFSEESTLEGTCFYCRNYTEIQKKNIELWNGMFKAISELPNGFVKRHSLMNLLKQKSDFIKSGVLKP